MGDVTVGNYENGCALLLHRNEELAAKCEIGLANRSIAVKRVIKLGADHIRMEVAQLRGEAYDFVFIITLGTGVDVRIWVKKNCGNATVVELDETHDCWRRLEKLLAVDGPRHVANRPKSDPKIDTNNGALLVEQLRKKTEEIAELERELSVAGEREARHTAECEMWNSERQRLLQEIEALRGAAKNMAPCNGSKADKRAAIERFMQLQPMMMQGVMKLEEVIDVATR